jgi:thioredoxin-like negative regulator of GroEL
VSAALLGGHAVVKDPRVVLAKVDCDAQPELKAAFKIVAFPTLLAFAPGSMTAVDKYPGDWNPSDILAWVNRVAGTGATLRGPAASMGEVPSLSDAAKAKMKARMERERSGGGGAGGEL